MGFRFEDTSRLGCGTLQICV